MFTHKLLAIVMALTLGTVSIASMATTADGTIGTTSQGAFDITLSVAPEVLVASLETAAVAPVLIGAQPANTDTNFCVYSSSGFASIRFTSTNRANVAGATEGRIEDPSDVSDPPSGLKYNLEIFDIETGVVSLTSTVSLDGTQDAQLNNIGTGVGVLSGCASDTMRATVKFIENVPDAGAYLDTVTIDVIP